MKMQLAENIKKYRKRAGLTQEALAEKLHTTRQSVSKWEQGTLEPNLQMLLNLSELFGISLDFLVKGDENHYEDECLYKGKSQSMNFWEFISQKWWLILIILIIICGTLSQILGW